VSVAHWIIHSADTSTTVAVLPKSKYAATTDADPALAGFHYAPGWPVQLPGTVISTPVVADLLGDGHLEVIVACRAVEDLSQGIREGEPLLFVFRADGSELPHWPVALQEQKPKTPGEDEWTSTPSVFRRDGKDNLVMVGGHAGVIVIHGDGSVHDLGGGSDWHDTIPLADLDGDGIPDIAIGKFIANVDGNKVQGWPPSKQLYDGYAPCVGDALQDGNLKLFHLFYSRPNNDNLAYVCGFDTHGDALPGWPQRIDDPSICAPVMGDVLGNGQMQVIASYGTHLFAWNPDGTPLPHTTSEDPLTAIFKSGLSAYNSSPALADLDGDGKPEIIIFDHQSHSIRAWHGDGTGFGHATPAAPPSVRDALRDLASHFTGEDNPRTLDPTDGLIATLPRAGANGVSVVSLGDDPHVIDFFTGVYWVRRLPDGKTIITMMMPQDIPTNWIQPTVADVEGNGHADVIFGLADGRVFVYRTGLAYHAERMQWPTANGNFQHTGAWHKPAALQAP
jgi:hypothetical protein